MTDIIPKHRRLPFDAEKAKRGDAVCTAEGELLAGMLQYYADDACANHPFYGRLVGGTLLTWTDAGNHWSSGSPHQYDLRMVAPEEPEAEGWRPANAAEMKDAMKNQIFEVKMEVTSEPIATPTAVDPSKLVPFDEARARNGEPVFTERGWPVTGFRWDLRGNYQYGGIVSGPRTDCPALLKADELRMLPKEKEQVWVALFGDRETEWWRVVGGLCNSRERAVQFAKNKGVRHIARCEIEEIE